MKIIGKLKRPLFTGAILAGIYIALIALLWLFQVLGLTLPNNLYFLQAALNVRLGGVLVFAPISIATYFTLFGIPALIWFLLGFFSAVLIHDYRKMVLVWIGFFAILAACNFLISLIQIGP